MTSAKILRKSIIIAIRNGWDYIKRNSKKETYLDEVYVDDNKVIFRYKSKWMPEVFKQYQKEMPDFTKGLKNEEFVEEFKVPVFNIIFSHSFAEAFWGQWEMQAENKTGIPIPRPFESATQRGSGMYIWQYHLQQMVLYEHPLEYLERFLDKEHNG